MEGVRSKFAKTCIISLFLLIVLRIYSYGLEISFRISGSLSYISPDHINQTLHGREEFLLKRSALRENWTYIQGEVKDVRLATSFEGEIVLGLNTRLAVGIGTGLIFLEATEEKTGITIERPQDTFTGVHPTEINAYPLRLSIYYFLPVREQLRLYIRGGGGLIWIKYVERTGFWYEPAKNFSQTMEQKAAALGYTFFSGLGIIWEANEFMGFFIETEANLSKISGFRGDTPGRETETLFFLEEYVESSDFWQAKIRLLKEQPTDQGVRSVEQAVVDLSGFSLKIGFTIKF